MSKKSIAEALKRLRSTSGLTADEVGAIIGKSGKTINAWENSRAQPDADTLMLLCDIYKVDNILDEFRDKTDIEKKGKKPTYNNEALQVVGAYDRAPDNVKRAIRAMLEPYMSEVAFDISPAVFDSYSDGERRQLHDMLDAELDVEKKVEEKSEVSSSGKSVTA